jgi:hypothetical protein
MVAADFEDAEGMGSGGFPSSASGGGSSFGNTGCVPRREEMGRRGGDDCCVVAGRLGAPLAVEGVGARRAEDACVGSAEDAAAAEEINSSGGKVLRGPRGDMED